MKVDWKKFVENRFYSTETFVKLRFFPKSVMNFNLLRSKNKMVGFSVFPNENNKGKLHK